MGQRSHTHNHAHTTHSFDLPSAFQHISVLSFLWNLRFFICWSHKRACVVTHGLRVAFCLCMHECMLLLNVWTNRLRPISPQPPWSFWRSFTRASCPHLLIRLIWNSLQSFFYNFEIVFCPFLPTCCLLCISVYTFQKVPNKLSSNCIFFIFSTCRVVVFFFLVVVIMSSGTRKNDRHQNTFLQSKWSALFFALWSGLSRLNHARTKVQVRWPRDLERLVLLFASCLFTIPKRLLFDPTERDHLSNFLVIAGQMVVRTFGTQLYFLWPLLLFVCVWVAIGQNLHFRFGLLTVKVECGLNVRLPTLVT